jgi:hypothetical protein
MILRRAAMIAVIAVAMAWVEIAAAAAPATVRLEVDGRYAADSVYGEYGRVRGWFPVTRVFLPLIPLARRYLDHAGARLVRGGDADGTLRIEITGIAQGQLYDFMENRQRMRRLRFIGARVEGRVSLTSDAGPTCGATFAGAIAARTGIPIIIGRDDREAANLAPFDQAIAEPGSLIAALAAVIGAAYGPAALAAAGGDDNPLVADHALAALGSDAVAVDCGGDWINRNQSRNVEP